MKRIERIDHADGGYEYRKDGKFHREEGPAVRSGAGDTWWFYEGLLHREDGGPAVEHVTGSKWWYRNGQLHREDGPAYEGADGTKAWFRDGKPVDPPSPPRSANKPPKPSF